eukprot:SAG11_NODE_31231_length_293_cov_1.592784_1_plen_63_part_01
MIVAALRGGTECIPIPIPPLFGECGNKEWPYLAWRNESRSSCLERLGVLNGIAKRGGMDVCGV